MCVSINPTETEHVIINHDDWGLQWEIQFPEMITVGPAVLKHFSTIQPSWHKAGPNDWSYQWRPDSAYVREKQSVVYKDHNGRPIYELVTGWLLHARIAAEGPALRLELALTNQNSHTAEMVACEGGCLHPANANQDFRGNDYPERSYVRRSGKMVGMSNLDRSLPTRCAYWSDPAGYDRTVESTCEDFWGRSKDRIDSPAVVGMLSADRSKAVVLAYECSQSALLGKRCLHSRPEFGNIAPGATVTRKGYIVFGDDIQSLAADCMERLL